MSKTIKQMAREAGFGGMLGTIPQMHELEAFANLVREQYRAELLAGVGEPVAHLVSFDAKLGGTNITDRLLVWKREDAEKQVHEPLIRGVSPLHTADQMAANALKAKEQGRAELRAELLAEAGDAQHYHIKDKEASQHYKAPISCYFARHELSTIPAGVEPLYTETQLAAAVLKAKEQGRAELRAELLSEGVDWPKAFDGVYEEGQWHRVYIKEQVQTMIAAAVLAEREQCAQRAEKQARWIGYNVHAEAIAAAIRKGEQT